MEAFGGKSVLLPSCSALNVLSLSLPLLLMGYYSQALFGIIDQSSCLSLWPLVLLKIYDHLPFLCCLNSYSPLPQPTTINYN